MACSGAQSWTVPIAGRIGKEIAESAAPQTNDKSFFSLMETAKVNALNLDDYLLHQLTVLPDRFAANADAAMDDLLPWAEGMRRTFALNTGDC